MITTVFILAALNLCLGLFVAAYAEQASARLVALLAAGNTGALPTQPQAADGTAAGQPAAAAATERVAEAEPFDPKSLPHEWQRLLDENRIHPRSTLESLLWTLKLELSILRSQLVHLEDQLKNTDEQADGHGSAQNATILGHWQTSHQEWTLRLNELAAAIAGAENKSTHGEIASALQDLVLDHQFDVQQTATSLKLMSDLNTEANAASSSNSATLRRQLSEQIDSFHLFRDRVDELLATYLRDKGQLDNINELLQIEGAAEIYNRIGLEVVFQEWRDHNPNGEQPVCCVLMDIDRFSQKNERFGNAAGDIIIAAFGGLLKSLIRIERGFDRVARFNGNSYTLFLGDTSIDDATMVAERTRQCIEATSFTVGEDTFDVTTSLGLVEFDPRQELGEFYKSLREAVAAAKNAGRNRTCVVRDRQLDIADIAAIHIKGRVIEIAAGP